MRDKKEDLGEKERYLMKRRLKVGILRNYEK